MEHNGITHFLSSVNQWIWGAPAVITLVGTGIFLSIMLRGIQFRGLKHAFSLAFGKYNRLSKQKGEISHFHALMTALSATIGTGNIAGVATAVLLGGPGAVFWMWVTAIVGMATKFCSCTLAIKYRQLDKQGEVAGGPMYTLKYGLKMPMLAGSFALLTIIASFGIGNTVQASSVINGLNFIIPSTQTYNGFIGILLALAVATVILGGVKRIAYFAAYIVPIMAIFYLGAGILVLLLHASAIPDAFLQIFNYAFNPHAATGGMIGAAIQFGTARGVFSNEAGLGSSAIIHAAAKTNEPVRQGLVAMLEPFFDTIIICTFTALVLIISRVWQPNGADTMQSTALTAQAFSQGLAGINAGASTIGSWIVGIGVIFFAYSSMLTWSYYGDRACLFLFGHQSVFIYRLIFTFMIFFGTIAPLRLVWQLADLANILMAIPNLICLVLLSPQVVKLTKDYFQRLALQQI